MSNKDVAAIVLAAGKGTRMQSDKPKVLHQLAGQPMLSHVLQALGKAGIEKIIVVLAPEMQEVASMAAPHIIAIQQQQRGTGDAVRAALPQLQNHAGEIVITNGDAPLITPDTITHLLQQRRAQSASVAVMGFHVDNPLQQAYGRLRINGQGQCEEIIEFKDAPPEIRAQSFCNGGVYAVAAGQLPALLDKLTDHNSQKEFYLTDIVGHAHKAGGVCVAVAGNMAELLGVNSKAELAVAEAYLQTRLRQQALQAGVTLLDPATVYLSADTQFGRDVVLAQHVVIGAGVTLADGVSIKPFSHLEQCSLGAGVVVGPFARLRPGTVIGAGAHIGNFVEVKNSHIGAGSKMNHLAYIGDATIGASCNIGAGTITCNYDGFDKHRTILADTVFIGSNSTLVAPIEIGEGAYVAAGSVLTESVPAQSMAFGRARQSNKADYAQQYRNSKKTHKKQS